MWMAEHVLAHAQLEVEQMAEPMSTLVVWASHQWIVNIIVMILEIMKYVSQ